MLEYAEKLTLLPGAMAEDDVSALRREGFTDQEIFSIIVAAAFRTFHTTVADALGLELRSDGAYDTEILRAFGVTQEGAHTTMYGDGLGPSGDQEKGHGARGRMGLPRVDGHSTCWVKISPPGDGRGERLCDEFARLTAPHSMRHLPLALSMKSDALEAALNFGRMVGMGGSGFGRRLEGVIGLVVAAVLGVSYTGIHHAQRLLDSGATPEEVEALVADPSGGHLTGREQEVARFCEKATSQPSAMTRQDVERLRSMGLGDREIVLVVCGVAFENFLCRAAAGLGVQLEDENVAARTLGAFEPAGRV